VKQPKKLQTPPRKRFEKADDFDSAIENEEDIAGEEYYAQKKAKSLAN